MRFTPETDLERALSSDPVLEEGLAWGEPRRGHPEGSVGAHVADLLATLALPLLVLGLVVSRLSLGIAVRRRRDKHHGNRSHEPRA